MDFEQNAVESDYDESYDSRQLVITNGRAVYMDTEEREEPIRRAVAQKEIEVSTGFEPARRRRPVQLPRYVQETEKKQVEEGEDVPVLVLPKGGWQVQHIKQPSFVTLSRVDAVLSNGQVENVATPRPRTTSPRPAWNRPNKWRNITTEVLPTSGFNLEPMPAPVVYMPAPVPQPERCPQPERFQSDRSSDGNTPVKRPPRHAPAVEDDEKRQNTKICRFVDITFKQTSSGVKTTEVNKCRRPNCTYAHTMSNWKPRPCRFQTGCRNMETCPFKHENETRESYYERTKNM